MRISRKHRAARWYGEHGLPVFRLRNKVPFKGSHGELDGTTDAATIDRLWIETPDADIGLSLRMTPHWVLDVDIRNFGHESLAALPPLPTTATDCTGGGGWHFFLNRTSKLEGITCTALDINGVDVSGLDVKGLPYGYVALPPSDHPSGRTYQWEASSRIDDTPIADPPDWLVDLIVRGGHRAGKCEPHEHHVDPMSFYLGVVFSKADALGKQIKPGIFTVRCPREHYHHSGKSFDSGAVIIAPKRPGGRGVFRCQHTTACKELR